MRLAYFAAGGPLGLLPLCQLAASHEVVAVVRPHTPRPWLHRLRRLGRRTPLDPITQFAQERAIPVLLAHSGSDQQLITQLTTLHPQLICIATFPWLLAPTLYTLAPHGAINLHSSLLPRHRGPTPLFWVYYHGDTYTGVTVHRVTQRADAGEILAQEMFPLPRGYRVAALHKDIAQRGAPLLQRTVEALEAGCVTQRPQDETLATRAPRVTPGTGMVDFTTWDVGQVWHFLAGLCPHFREPLRAPHGRRIAYQAVPGYTLEAHSRQPGSLERVRQGWHLYCRGGVVQLAETAPPQRSGVAPCSIS